MGRLLKWGYIRVYIGEYNRRILGVLTRGHIKVPGSLFRRLGLPKSPHYIQAHVKGTRVCSFLFQVVAFVLKAEAGC